MNLKVIFNLIFIALFYFTSSAQDMNQVGFESNGLKRIFLPSDLESKTFVVRNSKNKNVFTHKTTKAAVWEHSGTRVCIADVSELSHAGKYSMWIDGHAEDIHFEIRSGVYGDLGKAIVKSFYHSRASLQITEKHAGKYARAAGHPDNKVLIHASAASDERQEGSLISSPGGWYDAGDYNKYVVNSTITVFTLLHYVESFPFHAAELETNIPESANNIPDVLDELLYNLRWMMTMQDPHDGGLYHKLTSKKFCGMVMPEKDKSERYVVMKTTSASLDFSALMAKAARVLKKYEKELPGLADSCEWAAKEAWEWSVLHSDVLYVQADDIKTGQYGDQDISDEWFFAGVENYLTTGDKTYLKKASISKEKFGLPQWGKVNTLALYSLQTKNENALKYAEEAFEKLLDQVDKLLLEYKNSAYRISLKEFPWGSNSVLANQGILFLHAYQITGNNDYLEVAEAAANYILGANPTGYCFVTGFGEKRGMHVHERRSIADGIEEPVPGMLIGGPSRAAMHDCGTDAYPSNYPALSYVDKECSFSTNEIAINWSAAAAYLFLGLDAIYQMKNRLQ